MGYSWIPVVLVGLIVIVAVRMAPRKGKNEGQAMTAGQLEEALAQFAFQNEEDNKELLTAVERMKLSHLEQVKELKGRIDQLERETLTLKEQVGLFREWTMSSSHPVRTGETAATAQTTPAPHPQDTSAAPNSGASYGYGYRPVVAKEGRQAAASEQASVQQQEPEPASAGGLDIRNRYPDLFSLYENGKSIDQIAKRTGMNKGEISLIIQLAKQEEKLHD